MMKTIKILLFLLLLGASTQAQQFINTDSVKSYIDKYINNNATTAFQNKRLNTALKGLANLLDSVDARVVGGVRTVDSLWKYNDSTLAFRIKGVTYTVTGLGNSSGGVAFSGVSRDPTISGIGTPGSPLKVDTSAFKIATKTDLRRLADSISYVKDTLKLTGSITTLVTGGDTLLQLVGDASLPGPNKVYGTDVNGIKGFKPDAINNLTVTQVPSYVIMQNTLGGPDTIFSVNSTNAGIVLPIDYANWNAKLPVQRFLDTAAALRAAITSGGGSGGGPETDPTYIADKPILVKTTDNFINPGFIQSLPYTKITGTSGIIVDIGSYANPTWITSLDNSKITGLSSLLAAKSDATHNHSFDALVNVNMTGKTTGDLIMWSGTQWVKKTPDWMTAAAGDLRWSLIGHTTDANTITGTIPAARFGAATIPTNAINAAGGAAGKVLSYSDGWVTMSGGGITDGDKGDITVSGTGSALTIDAASVTVAKMAVIPTSSFIGRVTAGTNTPEVLTATQATSILNTFTTSLKGLAPASGGGTFNFLRADGTWAVPAPFADGDKGDITVGSSGTTLSIDAASVTHAKMANVATGSIIGRASAGTGAREELTPTQVTALLNPFTSSLKGLVPPSGGGTTTFLRADGTFATPAGGTALAAGSDNWLQYNIGTALSAEAALTYNPTTNLLSSDSIGAKRIKADSLNIGNGKMKAASFAIKKPGLGGMVMRFVTAQADTATGNRPYGNFNWTLDQSYLNPDDGQRDAVLHWGYNQNGGGGKENPNDASFHYAIESHYIPFPGGTPQFELIWQTVAKNGATTRQFGMNIQKNDGSSQAYWRTGNMAWFPDGTSETAYFAIGTGGAATVQGPNPQLDIQLTGAATPGHLRITPSTDGAVSITNYGIGRLLTSSQGYYFRSSAPAGNWDFDFNTGGTFGKVLVVRKDGQARHLFSVANNGAVYVAKDPEQGDGDDGAKLQILGAISIQDGTQGAGKVLTSDAAGKASWVTPSGGGGGGGATAYTDITSIPAGKLIGRYDGSTGTGQAITIGSGLNLDASGVLTASGGGGGTFSTNAPRWTADGDGVAINPTFRFGDDNWVWFRDDLNSTGYQYSLITKGGGSGSRRFMWMNSNNDIKFGSYIGDLNAASGVENAFFITPNISQSGTAGYTALLLNANTTGGTGSGTKKLMDLQINGTSVFTVNSTGSLKIVDGNQANGKVLTSDANGVATWQTASGGGGGGYTLPAATGSTLGGIIVGSGLSIDGSGVLSASGGGGGGLSGGTTNALTKWTSSTTVGNSIMSDDGSTVVVGSGVSPFASKLAVVDAAGGAGFDVAGNGGGFMYLRNTAAAANQKIWELSNIGTTFGIARFNDAGSVRSFKLAINDNGLAINTAGGGAPSGVALDVNGIINTNSKFTFGDANWTWFRDDASETGYQYSLVTRGGGSGTRRFMWLNSDNSIRFSSFIGNLSATSGVEDAFVISPHTSQGGTAGYNALMVNMTETGGVGSGTKNLLSLGVNGTSKLTVSNTGLLNSGAINAAGSITSTGSTSGFIVNRRDNNADAFALLSVSGNLDFYDVAGAATRMYMTSGGVLKYAADMSSSYDARSVVDRAYVDAIAASPYLGETVTLVSANYTVPTTSKIVNILIASTSTPGTITLPTGPSADKMVIYISNNSAATFTFSESIYSSSSTFYSALGSTYHDKLVYSYADSKWYGIIYGN